MAGDAQTVREVFAALSRPGRRSGAIMLIADDGTLSGIFTDSDLARLFEARRDDDFDRPDSRGDDAPAVHRARGSMLADAVAIMAERKISELPVVDAGGRAGRAARHHGPGRYDSGGKRLTASSQKLR